MAPSKSIILSILFIFPSLFHLCLSDGGAATGGAAPAEVNLGQLLDTVGSQVQSQVQGLKDVQGQAQCMHKLLPCQPFVKTPINPPPVCCDPLSELAKNGTDCLCTFFNDPTMLSTFNLSKDEVMKLPNACGVKVDVSKCNSGGGASGGASGGAANGGAAGTPVVDKEKQNSSSSTRMTSPYGITLFGVPGFIAMLIALVFSAY